jgi:myo-inositol-1(or 4)-monophosphatase
MPWDVAAGLVLAQEAGAKVVDRQGNAGALFIPSVIVSSPVLVEEFLEKTDGHPWRLQS